MHAKLRRMREAPERRKVGRTIEAAGVEIAERLEFADQLKGLRLGRLRRDPAPELRDCLDEVDVGAAAEVSCQRARATMI